MATDSHTLATAQQHDRAGRLSEAERSYRQVLEADPDHAPAWHLLGLLVRKMGRPEEAARCLRRATALNGSSAAYHSNLGLVLHEQGKLEDAAASYARALALQPRLAAAHNNLGNVQQDQGKFQEAVASYEKALRLQPDFAEARNNLANALVRLERLPEAQVQLEHAVRTRPGVPKIHLVLGDVRQRRGDLKGAAASFQRAVELDPRAPEGHANLANVLGAQGRLEEAVSHYRVALDLAPSLAEAHNNLGTVLVRQGRLDDAMSRFQRALELKPDYADAHFHRAMGNLTLGRFQEGFQEYEWRWKRPQSPLPDLGRPQWDGSPLGGRTILLHAEQGLGDTIQFIRYAALVKNRGGRVVVQCQKRLGALVSSCPGVDQVVERGDALPAFDVHVPLVSLPFLFQTTIATVPAPIPYMRARDDLVSKWGVEVEELGGGIKVGICWQGNPRHHLDAQRSVPLSRFSPLARVPGVRLVSLQKGPGSEQLADIRGRFEVMDFGERLDKDAGAFLDTAAIMKSLDLVVTTDTATAHLAGALGVQVRVAIPRVGDWRWMQDRSDCPWYPSMRLYRQEHQGDWGGVFERIAADVQARGSAAAESEPGASGPITAPIAPGELIDKITILRIKMERIRDPEKLKNVRTELGILEAARDGAVSSTKDLDALTAELKQVNEALWDVEDALRRCERDRDFGDTFVGLARSVYQHNDRRAALKRRINQILGSAIVEEKSYERYD